MESTTTESVETADVNHVMGAVFGLPDLAEGDFLGEYGLTDDQVPRLVAEVANLFDGEDTHDEGDEEIVEIADQMTADDTTVAQLIIALNDFLNLGGDVD